MTTTIAGFTITALAGGAAVQVSIADLLILPRFKQTFPRARFRTATRAWHVPGRLTVDRVVRFAEAVAQEQRPVRARIDRILCDAEFEGHAITLDTPGLDGHPYLTASCAQSGASSYGRRSLATARACSASFISASATSTARSAAP